MIPTVENYEVYNTFQVEARGMPGPVTIEAEENRIIVRLQSRGRCAICYKAKAPDCGVFGTFCHRCGSSEQLT